MNCPSCGMKAPPGVKFCGACGTPLPSAQAGGMSPAQAKVDQQLQELLPRIGVDRIVRVGPGHYICPKGSTHVEVRAIDMGGQVAVRSTAPVAIGSSICPDLMKFLLNHNAGFMFGAFGLDQKGTVGFSHAILASSMDVQELGTSVRTVLEMADKYDDMIVARWGGKTMAQTAIDQVLPATILQLMRSRK